MPYRQAANASSRWAAETATATLASPDRHDPYPVHHGDRNYAPAPRDLVADAPHLVDRHRLVGLVLQALDDATFVLVRASCRRKASYRPPPGSPTVGQAAASVSMRLLGHAKERFCHSVSATYGWNQRELVIVVEGVGLVNVEPIDGETRRLRRAADRSARREPRQTSSTRRAVRAPRCVDLANADALAEVREEEHANRHDDGAAARAPTTWPSSGRRSRSMASSQAAGDPGKHGDERSRR